MSKNKSTEFRKVYCKIAVMKSDILSIIIKENHEDIEMMRVIIKNLEKIQNEIQQYINLKKRTLNSTLGLRLTNSTTEKLIKAAITKAAGTEKK